MVICDTIGEIEVMAMVQLQTGTIRVLIGIEQYVDSVILVITAMRLSSHFQPARCGYLTLERIDTAAGQVCWVLHKS